MEQVNVLHVMNGAVSGGISMTVLNMYNALGREQFHFDCTVYDKHLGKNGSALKNMGCEFFELPMKSHHPIKYAKLLTKIIHKGNYKAIHVHHNWSSYYSLMIAKHCGIENRIAHAHSNYTASGFLGKSKMAISHFLLNRYATKLVSCSTEAAVSIFGTNSLQSDKLSILKNCIYVSQFKYNSELREEIRKHYGLVGKFVIGCVGNLGPEKNIGFALDVLKEMDSHIILMIVGDGSQRRELENKATQLGIQNRTVFLGRQKNVNELLQAFDAFIMPSLYEGFGIAALEAAAAGLPLFLSRNIPKDFEFYTKCTYLSVDDSPEDWASSIIKNTYLCSERKSGAEEVIKAGYDISENRRAIEELYKENAL